MRSRLGYQITYLKDQSIFAGALVWSDSGISSHLRHIEVDEKEPRVTSAARKTVASMYFLFAGWLALILCTVPGTLEWGGEVVAGTLAGILIGVLLARPVIWRRPSRWVAILIVSMMVTLPFVVIVRAFGAFDVLAFVFHAQFGIEGFTLAGFGYEVLEAFVAVLSLGFIGIALGNIWGIQRLAIIAASVTILGLNPAVRFGQDYLSAEAVESNLHKALIPAPTVTAPETRPDIIIVYLEGLERIYADTDQFGNIYAPLRPYAERGIDFTQVKQIRGTSWSLAGVVASQCGVPLLPNGFRNAYRFKDQVEFLSTHTCLSDVTHDLGYTNAFVVGANQDFGGMNHFLRSHRFHQVVDVEKIQEMVPEDMYQKSQLGDFLDMQILVDDAVVFDAATLLHDELVSLSKPFMLVVETFGPHGTSSILSRNCTTSGRMEATSDVEAAITCTLADMQPFLDRVESVRNGRPAMVMLLSDHLNHDVDLNARIPRSERSNTVIMFPIGDIDPIVPAGTKVSRPASMVDVYPTFLAYAGLSGADVGVGLGRSLFGEDQTILESKGLNQFENELFPNVPLAQQIWAGTRN